MLPHAGIFVLFLVFGGASSFSSPGRTHVCRFATKLNYRPTPAPDLNNDAQRSSQMAPSSGYGRFSDQIRATEEEFFEESEAKAPFGFSIQNELINGRMAILGLTIGLIREKITGESLLGQLGVVDQYQQELVVGSIVAVGLGVGFYHFNGQQESKD
jgi:hypothetical protein